MQDADGWFGFWFCVVGLMTAADIISVAGYLSGCASQPDSMGSSPSLATIPVIYFSVTNPPEAQWQPFYYIARFPGMRIR